MFKFTVFEKGIIRVVDRNMFSLLDKYVDMRKENQLTG